MIRHPVRPRRPFAPGPVLAAMFAAAGAAAGPAPIRVLMITGQNNHNWRETAPIVTDILVSTGRFRVEASEQPETLCAADLEPFDVVLSHWNTFGKKATVTDWPAETKRAYLDFVRDGKGHVVLHAGSSSFPDWDEYQALCGATWAIGTTGHGPVHEFPVRPAAVDHPVTRGMTAFTTLDELWHRPGIRPGVMVIAESYSSADRRGTGAWEPGAMVNSFGQGRNFTLLLGHHAPAMQSDGFRALLARGVEWAATGEVTIAPPAPAGDGP